MFRVNRSNGVVQKRKARKNELGKESKPRDSWLKKHIKSITLKKERTIIIGYNGEVSNLTQQSIRKITRLNKTY